LPESITYLRFLNVRDVSAIVVEKNICPSYRYFDCSDGNWFAYKPYAGL
jgi:hypothetical protein